MSNFKGATARKLAELEEENLSDVKNVIKNSSYYNRMKRDDSL